MKLAPIASQVRRQRHQRRGDCARALQRPPDDDPGNRLGLGGDDTAEAKDQQATDDHGLAPYPIRQQAERQLEQTLGEAVDTDRQPDQQRRGACIVARMQAENRQNHEQAEHAQAEHERERNGGPFFGCKHLAGARDGVERRDFSDSPGLWEPRAINNPLSLVVAG